MGIWGHTIIDGTVVLTLATKLTKLTKLTFTSFSAPAQNVRIDIIDVETREVEIRWSPPPQRDINGVLTGYQVL